MSADYLQSDADTPPLLSRWGSFFSVAVQNVTKPENDELYRLLKAYYNIFYPKMQQKVQNKSIIYLRCRYMVIVNV